MQRTQLRCTVDFWCYNQNKNEGRMKRWDTVVDRIIMDIEAAIQNFKKAALWTISSDERDPKEFKCAIEIYLKELVEKNKGINRYRCLSSR